MSSQWDSFSFSFKRSDLSNNHTMDSSGTSILANNQDQDYDAMDVDIDMEANDSNTEQQSSQADVAGPDEQISKSQNPRPATVARMLRPLVRDIIEDAEEDMFYYSRRLQRLQASCAPVPAPAPTLDPSTDSDSDLDQDTDMSEAPAPQGLLDQPWNFSNLNSDSEKSSLNEKSNVSKPLTNADIMSLALMSLEDGTIRSQAKKIHKRKTTVNSASDENNNICTKAIKVTKSNSVACRRQVSLPRDIEEKRKSRDIAHKRVMGEAKVLKH